MKYEAEKKTVREQSARKKDHDTKCLFRKPISFEEIIKGSKIVNLLARHPLVVFGTISLPLNEILPTMATATTVNDPLDEPFLLPINRDNRTRFVMFTGREEGIVVLHKQTKEGCMEGGENIKVVG